MADYQDFYIIRDGVPQSYFMSETEAVDELSRRKSNPETSAEYAEATAIPCDQYFTDREADYLARPPVEISAERYDELLNVLPPIGWTRADGVERFVVGEAVFSRIYTACAARDGRCLSVYVRLGDRSTYPTAATFDQLANEVRS